MRLAPGVNVRRLHWTSKPENLRFFSFVHASQYLQHIKIIDQNCLVIIAAEAAICVQAIEAI